MDTVFRLTKEYPEAGAYATAYEMVDEKGTRVFPSFLAIPLHPWSGFIPDYFKSALGPPPVWSSAVTIPKKIFEELSMFPLGVRRGEDHYMWGKVALHYPIAFTTEIMAIYRMDATNRAGHSLAVEEFPLIEYVSDYLQSHALDADKKYYLMEYLNMKQLAEAARCILSGDKVKAQYFLSQAANTQEFRKRFLLLKICSHIPVTMYRSLHLMRNLVKQ